MRLAARHSGIVAAFCMTMSLAPMTVWPDSGYWTLGAAAGRSAPESSYDRRIVERIDFRGVAWRAVATRRLNQHVAFGLGYSDLGAIELSGSSYAGFRDRTHITLFDVQAIALWPIATRIEIYGTAGLARWDQRLTQSSFGQTVRFSATGSSFAFGAGASWWLSDALGLQLEWRIYRSAGDYSRTTREDDWQILTLGSQWRMGR